MENTDLGGFWTSGLLALLAPGVQIHLAVQQLPHRPRRLPLMCR